jgi:uncharacterized protein YbcI
MCWPVASRVRELPSDRLPADACTRARTYFNDDMITVVLQDTLTKGETALLDNGQRELVLVTRKTFQDVMGPDLVAGIEQITQRKVIAFLSANHVDPDVAIETFLLAPSVEHTPAQQLAEAMSS